MSSIEIDRVSKRFGPVEIISELSLRIESGEFIAFLGASGCGKTTLLRMIAGLETINSGEIRIGGAVKTALRVSFALTQKSPGRPAMDMEPYETVLGAILARRGEAASDAMRRLLELSRLRVLTALDKQPVAAKIAG